jgi:hypothetical protein
MRIERRPFGRDVDAALRFRRRELEKFQAILVLRFSMASGSPNLMSVLTASSYNECVLEIKISGG